MSADPWQLLGIDRSDDVTAIRRAYSRQLKAIDPEVDPAAFIALREARDWALAAARSGDDVPFVTADPEPMPAYADEEPVFEPAAPRASRPAEPDPDREAIERLRAMLFDPGVVADADAIAAQAQVVLASPAMLNIDHSSRVEAFFVEAIVEATPRSDPLVEPAIAHFRWDAAGNELHRAPVIDWILRRREDRYFEIGLPSRSALLGALLGQLRGPAPTRWQRTMAWRLGPRMEYLIAYLRANHPTTLAGVNPDTLAWWDERIAGQHRSPLVLRRLADWRRQMAWQQGIDGAEQGRNIGLYLLIFLLPYAAVWILLRQHYSWKQRVAGFGYLGLWVFLILQPTTPAPDPRRVTSAPSITAPPPPPVHFRSFPDDLEQVLFAATAGSVTAGQLSDRNPKLSARLTHEWRLAQQGDDWTGFRSTAFELLQDTLVAALHGNDGKLIADHARAYAGRLRWAARGSAEECDDIMHGRPGASMLADFKEYQAKLVGRAVLSGVPPAARRRAGGHFTVPPALFDDALQRSRLSPGLFKASVLDKGTAAGRCVAEIALIDAAVEGGAPGTALLREMF